MTRTAYLTDHCIVDALFGRVVSCWTTRKAASSPQVESTATRCLNRRCLLLIHRCQHCDQKGGYDHGHRDTYTLHSL